MHEDLTDIELVQRYFKVDEKKAQVMIDRGLNLKYIRTGYIKTEQERLTDKYQTVVDDIVDEDILNNTHISYAGVSKEDDKLFATGGRVLVCVGFGKTIKEARDRAYALCGQVHYAGKKIRTDIAYQAL